MRTLGFIVTLAASALALVSCQSGHGQPRLTWRVASDLANPPFAWLDEAGVARGRDVEMAQQLAEIMNAKLEWHRMEFAVLLDALEQGEADAVIATMGATPERAERVLLSNAYFVTNLRVLVRRGANEPTSLAALDGLRVSAGIGTTSELALRDQLPRAIPAAPSEKGATSIERLLAGEVDALIMDGPDALDFAREYPNELAVLDEPLAEERYVVAVKPTGAEWLERINVALYAMRESGALSELDRRFELTTNVR